MSRRKDPFEKAPEFLAAFDNIVRNGFFEELQLTTGNVMAEGRVNNCSIRASGCVPNSSRHKQGPGCGALIDPENIILAARRLSATFPVKGIFVEVKTEDWPLWDAAEANVIGSRGTRTRLSICITFNANARRLRRRRA